jgi:hypothetical protein
MPIHDWTRVPSGLFHHFHQMWSASLTTALNDGRLPKGHFAYIEQKTGGPEPDIIAVHTGRRAKPSPGGGTAVLTPPRTKLVARLESDEAVYARKANRVVIRHHLGEVVAVIEIVSPGNKDGRDAFESFVRKAVAFLRAGVHLVIVDLFPPTPRDPQGVHKAILDGFKDLPFDPPPDKPLTLVGYSAGDPLTAYIEPVAVGDPMPDMPLFLTPDEWVPVPLEPTYQATWAVCPEPIRELVEPPPPPTAP